MESIQLQHLAKTQGGKKNKRIATKETQNTASHGKLNHTLQFKSDQRLTGYCYKTNNQTS